jgi:putative ABC transport system permease protein
MPNPEIPNRKPGASHPPRLARAILCRLFPDQGQFTTVGDLDEFFYRTLENKGAAGASLYYWHQTLRALPYALCKALTWKGMMILRYGKMTLRHIRKHKTYSLLNVLSLSMGIACTFLMILINFHQLSFDRFHRNANRILRLGTEYERGGKTVRLARGRLKGIPLLSDLPEVESAVPLLLHYSQELRHGEKQILVDPCYTQKEFFDIFSFPLLAGDPGSAMSEPGTAVITPDLAKKLFGAEDPLGKVVTMEKELDFRITGILKPFPPNSHFQTSFIGSYRTLPNNLQRLPYVYFRIRSGTPMKNLESRVNSLLQSHSLSKRPESYFIQKLTDIYMADPVGLDTSIHGNAQLSLVLTFAAVAILFISCFNFMNLACAQVLSRAREAGVRKVLGAHRAQLVRQFMTESMVLTGIASLLGFLLILMLLPRLQTWMRLSMTYHLTQSPQIYLFFAGLLLLVGMSAGLYPALMLSRFRPALILKRGLGIRPGWLLRNALILIQFLVSCAFLASALVLSAQVRFILNKDLGLDQENIVLISYFKDQGISNHTGQFMEEVAALPEVEKTALYMVSPGYNPTYPQIVHPEGPFSDENFDAPLLCVEPDYFSVFNIPLISGRLFSTKETPDANLSFVINETAVKAFGWDQPLGRHIRADRFDREGTVVGVIRDFHMETLHRPIRPYIFYFDPDMMAGLAVKVHPADMKGTLDRIRSVWQTIATEEPFYYRIFEDKISNLYHTEKTLLRVVLFGTLFMLIIACMGLFGLTLFRVRRRTKEIGIRRVLGAGTARLGLTLSRDFLYIVLTANLTAFPLVYWFMRRWLQNFNYHIAFPFWIFPAAVLASTAVALGVIYGQTWRASRANPVNALRYE